MLDVMLDMGKAPSDGGSMAERDFTRQCGNNVEDLL
jgi:hypothetical protein